MLRESCSGAHSEAHLWYSVYAVVEHTGSLKGGHYVAYVRVDDRASSDSELDVLCVLERCQLLLQEKDLLSLRKLLELYLQHTRREQSEMEMCAAAAAVRRASSATPLPQAPACQVTHLSADASVERPQKVDASADGVGDPAADCSTPPVANGELLPPSAATETAANKSASRWFYVSDSLVQPVSSEKAFAAQAYLLFYQRL